jgi:hypothetical protein
VTLRHQQVVLLRHVGGELTEELMRLVHTSSQLGELTRTLRSGGTML